MGSLTPEDVFAKSASCEGEDAEEKLDSPGIEGIYALFEGEEIKVSMDDIRDVYEKQEWDETMSLNLEQFTTLWTAVVHEMQSDESGSGEHGRGDSKEANAESTDDVSSNSKIAAQALQCLPVQNS